MGAGKVTPLQRGPRPFVHFHEVRSFRFGFGEDPFNRDKRSLWQGGRSPGKFPDQEILPDEDPAEPDEQNEACKERNRRPAWKKGKGDT